MPNIKLTGEFKGVPNQKAFRVNKKRESDSKTDVRISDLFKKDIFEACKNLKDTTFKVYMYLISNQDGYIGGLSKVDVLAQTGISESSYKRAIKELEEKGYLLYSLQRAQDSSGALLPLYEFYSRPHLSSN